jgi:hypothetical protein
MARDAWHARSWSDKLRVWFAPPGWRPADVAARFPKLPYDPARDFVRFDPPRPAGIGLYVLAQFTALMVANSHFLAVMPRQPLWAAVLYFVWILFSLVSLGGLLEGRDEFLPVEAGRLALTAMAAWLLGDWAGVRDARVVWAIAVFSVISLAALSRARRDAAQLREHRLPLAK